MIRGLTWEDVFVLQINKTYFLVDDYNLSLDGVLLELISAIKVRLTNNSLNSYSLYRIRIAILLFEIALLS